LNHYKTFYDKVRRNVSSVLFSPQYYLVWCRFCVYTKSLF